MECVSHYIHLGVLCACACMYVCVCVCVCVRACVRMCICMYVQLYVYMQLWCMFIFCYSCMCMHKAWHRTVCVCMQWDLADTPRWLTLHPREAYRGADGILILYSSIDMVGSTWLNGLTHVLYHMTERVGPCVVSHDWMVDPRVLSHDWMGWPTCCITWLSGLTHVLCDSMG